MSGAVCKGAWALGTACGDCQRCDETKAAWVALGRPIGDGWFRFAAGDPMPVHPDTTVWVQLASAGRQPPRLASAVNWKANGALSVTAYKVYPVMDAWRAAHSAISGFWECPRTDATPRSEHCEPPAPPPWIEWAGDAPMPVPAQDIVSVQIEGEKAPRTGRADAFHWWRGAVPQGDILAYRVVRQVPAEPAPPRPGEDGEPQPWQPVTNALDVAILGKAIEEAGELVAILGRCLIQGMDGVDPTSGKSNRLALQEELADNMAQRYFLEERYNLDQAEMSRRWSAKIAFLKLWHRKISAP